MPLDVHLARRCCNAGDSAMPIPDVEPPRRHPFVCIFSCSYVSPVALNEGRSLNPGDTTLTDWR